MKSVLAIDVGGTTTRVAAIDDRGRIGAIRRFDTPDSLASLGDRLTDAATHLMADSGTGRYSFDAIYMAVPGILAADETTVERSVHCPWLEHAPLTVMVAQRLRAPVRLATDAAAATFGEFMQTDGPCAVFAHLRLGTGAAFGLIVGGRLQMLPRPNRGHLSCLRLPIDVLDARCACGQRGCLEAAASGPALERAARAAGFAAGLAELQTCVERGDARATGIVRAASAAVLHVVAGIVSRWRVEAFVMGGGVLVGLPCLSELLLQEADRRKLPLQAARLGDEAGVIGVALACRGG